MRIKDVPDETSGDSIAGEPERTARSGPPGLGDFIKEQEKWEAQTLVEHGDALAGMAMVITPDTPLLKKAAE